MMRTPVISDLAYKLSLGDNASDADLRALIDYVDAKYVEGNAQAIAPSWATEDDIALVKSARLGAPATVANATVLIPNYSKAIPLAKDFLKYVYSDAGLKLFAEKQRNCLNVTPSDPTIYDSIDKSTWSTFSKSVYELSASAELIPFSLSHPVWYNAGRREIWTGVVPETRFTYDPSNDNFMDAEEFVNDQWNQFQKEWKTSYYKYF